MCLARVEFVGEENQRDPELIEDVALIQLIPEGLEVTDLLGGVRILEGRIQKIDFMESVVCVGQQEAASAPRSDDG